MKVYFVNTGCSAEAEDFLRFIRFAHAEQTENFFEADVIIAHFCAMCTESFEDIPSHMTVLHGIKKVNSKVKIYIGGCASEVIDLQKRYPFVDGVFNRRHMVEDLEAYFNYDHTYDSLPISYLNMVRIQSGCARHCGFCKAAYLNMHICSKPICRVLEDVEYAVSNGYPDIVLHAENSTEYGLDLPGRVRLIDLLKKVDKIEGVKSIFLTGLCIDELATDPELVAYIKNSSKIYKLQLEIQSLIPEVRKNMCLTSSVEDVLRIIAEFSNKYIITNIMLGYPGETAENFQKELELIEKHGLYFLQLNTYNDTPGVYAHSLEQVSKPEVAARMDMLIKTISALRTKKAEEIRTLSKQSGILCIANSSGRFETIGASFAVKLSTQEHISPGQIVKVKVTGISDLFHPLDPDQTMYLKGAIM